ncbi:MAG: gamma-glutamyl-gamma-aminobutyrate hydrolase family protein [Anaerolineales bacterium]
MHATAKPLIGVTTYRMKSSLGISVHGVAEAYLNAVQDAGGLPVMIPLGLPEETLSALLARLDGILFTGGGDIDPAHYNQPDDTCSNDIDPDRDRVEFWLLKQSLAENKPLMGICRGFQLVNVGLGGSLYSDVESQMPAAQKHDFYPDWARDYLAHPVRLEPGTRLAEILGTLEIEVNSLHHQSVRTLGAGIIPLAYAPDGTVEALEIPGNPFGIAVQWHPEWLQAYEPMRNLFRAFIQTAGRA